MIRIVLADDHIVVRKGLRILLESESDFSVVGEAENGLDAISVVERLKPDILIVDLMMPHINGLEITRRLHQKYPDTGILILSMYSDEAYVSEALRSGAKAYLLKESLPESIIKAVREVSKNSYYSSPPLKCIFANANKANMHRSNLC